MPFYCFRLALLKDDGKLCYIIPQTVLTAGDLDAIRYHLKIYYKCKIPPYSKMFINRGVAK